jgi:hypothetical protein
VFAVDVSTGGGLLVTSVILATTGWFTLPKFMGQLGGATAMVDALHAKDQLAMTGTPMTARLLSVQQTGALINMNPQVMTSRWIFRQPDRADTVRDHLDDSRPKMSPPASVLGTQSAAAPPPPSAPR